MDSQKLINILQQPFQVLTNLAYTTDDLLIPVEKATLSPSMTQLYGAVCSTNFSNLLISCGVVFTKTFLLIKTFSRKAECSFLNSLVVKYTPFKCIWQCLHFPLKI